MVTLNANIVFMSSHALLAAGTKKAIIIVKYVTLRKSNAFIIAFHDVVYLNENNHEIW